MARQRKEKPLKDIKLQHPDRSGPSDKTLLHMAEERKLFAQADARARQAAADAPDLSPGAERFLESALWTATLAMLHFTFDVLVQNQYGEEVDWAKIYVRTARAWFGFLILFYPLHPSTPNAVLIPGLPTHFQKPLRQAVFFLMSLGAGCSLIYISNSAGYLANMKQAPPLGCLWLWAVIELDLIPAAASLVGAVGFIWRGGYDFK